MITHGTLTTTETYYEGSVSSTKQEVEMSLFTTKQGILRDVIDALAVISTGETTKLSMEVCIDKQGRYRLVKRWVV